MASHPPPYRIAGFDPGLNTTGYGVVEWSGAEVRLLEAGTVRPRSDSLEARLAEIHAGHRATPSPQQRTEGIVRARGLA